MPRLTVVANVCVLVLSACGDHSVTSPPARSLGEFETRLERLQAESHIPAISVVIAKDRRIIWARAFGLRDIASNVKADTATPFHLASLTKTFASRIILQLVDEGRVSLDDPVSQYGNNLPSTGTIRVRHLLTHTSEGTPGDRFIYNGNRFGELDSVVHHVTGLTFAQALQARILAPLALKHTAPNSLSPLDFSVTGFDREGFEASMARGYTFNGTSQVATTYPTYFGTAAGLIASAADVAAYSMAIDRDMFLQPATKELAFTPTVSNGGQTLPYGLGWFVSYFGGLKVVWHYGLWTANSALIVKVPARGLTYVVLANSDELSKRYDFNSDLRNSPWAREFIDAFVTGDTPLPQ